MALITKRLLAEQVAFKLFGGDFDISSPVQYTDIYKSIEQVVNSAFRVEQFQSNLPSGETIPNGVMIASYTDINVSSFGSVSKSLLPVIPISLPRNLGVFSVLPAASLNLQGNYEFIPVLKGQIQLLRVDTLLNGLLNQFAYEVKNNAVIYNKDITLLGITKVDIDLCVFDISIYSETDVLPIPSSMEESIVDTLVAKFSNVLPETGKVNLLTSVGQQNK